MSTQELTDRQKLKALPWNLAFNTVTNIFFLWTVGGSVFPLFLNEAGLDKSQIGVALSFLPFSGMVALIFAPVAARLGWKRVFITCYGTRYPVISLLLLLPWMIGFYGRQAAIIFLLCVLAVFALLRALGETAYYPWMQEFVPNQIRGKYNAWNTVLSTLVSAVAMLAAGAIIGATKGLTPFLILLGIGIGLGIFGILLMFKVPGGAPRQPEKSGATHAEGMKSALLDKNFTAYLGGMGGATLGAILLTSFLPLYLKEQMGLPASLVVTLDTAMLVGGGVSSLVWGWAADRVGSRPVLMPSLTLCLAVPLVWLVLPTNLPHPAAWVSVLSALYGVATSGLTIAGTRLLFNGVISPEKTVPYTALYYAWQGITGGTAPLLAGGLLSALGGWQIMVGGLPVNGFRLLFAMSWILLAFSWLAYYRVKPDAAYTTRHVLKRLITRLRGHE